MCAYLRARVRVCVCVCVRACVRRAARAPRVRACVRTCVRACECECACVLNVFACLPIGAYCYLCLYECVGGFVQACVREGDCVGVHARMRVCDTYAKPHSERCK